MKQSLSYPLELYVTPWKKAYLLILAKISSSSVFISSNSNCVLFFGFNLFFYSALSPGTGGCAGPILFNYEFLIIYVLLKEEAAALP